MGVSHSSLLIDSVVLSSLHLHYQVHAHVPSLFILFFPIHFDPVPSATIWICLGSFLHPGVD